MLKILNVICLGFSLAFGVVYAGDEVKLGNLKIEDAYTRATVPAQKMGGGFVQIENKGGTDKLIGVSSSVAKEMQLHSMSMEGNIMKMREVKSIDVPANGEVKLQPGGLHLMFIGLNKQLKAGESVPVKLKFEKAGEIEIQFHVKDPGASHGMDHGHM